MPTLPEPEVARSSSYPLPCCGLLGVVADEFCPLHCCQSRLEATAGIVIISAPVSRDSPPQDALESYRLGILVGTLHFFSPWLSLSLGLGRFFNVPGDILSSVSQKNHVSWLKF